MSKLPKTTEKRFTGDSIISMKATLEKRYKLKLQLQTLNDHQVFLMCEGSRTTKCTFIYFFRKIVSFSNQEEYALLFSSSEHSYQCNQKRRAIESPIEFKSPSKQSRGILDLDSNHKQNFDHLHIQSNEFDLKHNPESHSEKQKKGTQNSFNNLQEPIIGDRSQCYREGNFVAYAEQLLALKKTLVHRYKALVSKSTYLDPILNIVTKISFRCKNADKIECPFLQVLNLVPQSETSPVYQLQSINNEHNPDCILDCQDLRYHEMTKKIDDSIEIIEDIVKKLGKAHGDSGIRPKTVLDMLAQALGQENSDFIYEGLDRRNNRRAVKKYFDNAVGKVRNRQKFQF